MNYQAKEGAAAETEAKSAQHFPIVGIGASAGGLEAFTDFLDNLPTNTGMAFVFVQHLAPEQESLLTDILARSTKMPVHTVQNDMRVEPNNVYVIPPAVNMTISQGVLHLQRQISKSYRPVDEFLTSLAQDRKNLAVGVILSGTGSDGTEGLKAIYAEGGITFAQLESTAKYPGMPHSAMTANVVNFSLPPNKIAEKLATVGRHPRLNHTQLKVVEHEPKEEDNMRSILSMLKLRFGVDFGYYKPQTISRRISRRMVIHTFDTIEEYVKFLRKNSDELQALYDDMLIGVTSFFREPETFKTLTEQVFPAITKDKLSTVPIRIWVPGCATGEEVYSLAILLREYLEKTKINVSVQIFGTDVNEKYVERARTGIYPESIEADMSEERLNRFFARIDHNYQVNKFIREMCVFAKQDIAKDPPFSNLDLISCRNVLIYFKPILQEKVLPIFHYALKSDGFLVLGVSESVGAFEDLFAPLNKKGPVYTRRMAPTRAVIGIEPFYEYQTKETRQRVVTEKPMDLLQKEIDKIMLTKYVPAGVVVNSEMEIVAFRGDTGPFLKPAPGQASFSLTKMAREELRFDLQSVVFKAKKERKPVVREGVEFKDNGQTRAVDIQVSPVKVPNVMQPFFLITFENASPKQLSTVQPPSAKGAVEISQRRVAELKQELASTRESLQTIIEEQEATNEELRSALEEIQSSNEELQSTNEERETAREELQSANEELNTLNEELAKRNREVVQTLNDLNNVFNSINMAIIIVDIDLKLRVFTPVAENIFHVLPSDVGRSITDIKLRAKIGKIDKMILDVINNLTVKEGEIEDEDGHCYMMRIRPYLTEEKKINGAVISFMDIGTAVGRREK